MITNHPADPAIEGALIRAGHIRADLAEAAREYFRPLTSAELDDVTQEMTTRIDEWDDRLLATERSLFYTANELLSTFAVFAHDH